MIEPMPLRTLLVILGLLVVCAPALSHQRRPTATGQAAIPSLLDRYEAGDHPAAAEWSRTVADFGTFSRSFVRAAESWAALGGPEHLHRRRLLAASVVLEIAWAFSDSVHTSQERSRHWPALRGLIEWACRLVRSDASQTSAEEMWFRASFELLLRVQDPVFLFGMPGGITAERVARIDGAYGSSLDHLSHGISRFPRNAQFHLLRQEGAEVWLPAARWVLVGRSVSPTDLLELRRKAHTIRQNRGLRTGIHHPADGEILGQVDFLTKLDEARVRIAPLVAMDDIGARAHLDLGVIDLCFGRTEQALQHFTEIDRYTDETAHRFLGWFLQGRIHARERRLDASERAYRRAQALLATAQSAAIALAEILFTTGRPGEAAALVREAIASASGVPDGNRASDPWFEFVVYGRRTSPDALIRLRRMLIS